MNVTFKPNRATPSTISTIETKPVEASLMTPVTETPAPQETDAQQTKRKLLSMQLSSLDKIGRGTPQS